MRLGDLHGRMTDESDPGDEGVPDPVGRSLPSASASDSLDGAGASRVRHTRRGFLAVVAASATGLAGCLSGSGFATGNDPTETARVGPEDGDPAQRRGAEAGPVEVPGWQLADVRVERQFSFVGASAVVYNTPGGHDRSARIRFRLYSVAGRLEFEGTDTVAVPDGEERRVARWWRLDPVSNVTPEIGFADVEIVDTSA